MIYLNGLVNSTNDSIKRMSMGCLSTFTKTYYMIEDNEKNYYTTSCTDFEIYSSYKS